MSVNYDEPVPIQVTVTNQPRPKELRVAHRTFVLTASQPYAEVTGYDPGLKQVRLNVLDNPIVVSRSISGASDPNNLSGTLAAPNGRIFAIGNDYEIPGPDELWISTNTYPTRVGITIVREI